LNPLSIHWPHFVVAQTAGGAVVGIGQIKILGDGTQELASLGVDPAYQGQRIGEALMWTLMRRAQGPLYLRCAPHNESYYLRFGFRTLTLPEMPHDLARIWRIVHLLTRIYNRFTRSDEWMLVMGR
jgi:predicted N-acetyltransferase YhbS